MDASTVARSLARDTGLLSDMSGLAKVSPTIGLRLHTPRREK